MFDNQNMEETEVLELKDAKTVPDIIHQYSLDVKRGHVPLVIDNGERKCAHARLCSCREDLVILTFLRVCYFTLQVLYMLLILISFLGSYKCRVGWATHSEPSLIFKNLVAKTRKERGKKVLKNQ